MNIADSYEALKLRYYSWKLALLFACGGLVCFGRLMLGYEKNPGGCCIGMIFSFFIAFCIYERAVFVFDKVLKKVFWERGRAFSTCRGVIEFDEIVSVEIESSSSRNKPLFRVVLVGEAMRVPICLGFSAYDSQQSVAIRIRKVLLKCEHRRESGVI